MYVQEQTVRMDAFDQDVDGDGMDDGMADDDTCSNQEMNETNG